MDNEKRRFHGYDNDFIRGIDDNFGKYARTRRTFLEYSQGLVATMMQTTYGIKWHQTVVAKIEDGTRKIKLMEAYALADMYGIPLEELSAGNNLEGKITWTERKLPDGGIAVKAIWNPEGDNGDD